MIWASFPLLSICKKRRPEWTDLYTQGDPHACSSDQGGALLVQARGQIIAEMEIFRIVAQVAG